ncbi:MAG: bifunctional oligoribonuclease/PAP phosphatase NrnA [Elusimicrobia bacterium]|nr:bifunctional oligoribonuclease/PAP phosphatase NrnA [Elusimicrobiota bacterium]
MAQSKNIQIKTLPSINHFDIVVLLECSTPSRAGNIAEILSGAGAVISIDHHRTAEHYADINYVDSKSSSTAEMVYDIILGLGLKLTAAEATCLYVGIATDTGRFHYPATTAGTFKTASELLLCGARSFEANDIIYSTKALPSLKLLGRAMEHLKIRDGGKSAVSYITGGDLKFAKADYQHGEDIVNYGLMAPGVKVSVLFRQDAGRVSVNFRSRGNIDVSALAKKFGGGGHKNAAGLKSKLPFEKIKQMVLKELSGLYR